MRAVRGLPGFRHFFGSRRGGGHGAGITSDRKDGPIGEMSDDEASSAAAAHGKKLVGDMEDELDIDNECCICLIDMEERKFRGKMDCCDHVVCWCCIQEWAQTSRSCPICQRSYNKCKKTTPKAKKGRKHKPNGAKGKKQRSLWEKVGGGILGRRLRSARSSPAQAEQQPPNLVAQSSWGDMGDEEADVDVDAGEEEVVVFPMRDSRGDDDDVGAAAVDGAAAAADASSSDDSDSRGSRRSNEEEANEEGNDMIIVNIINDDDNNPAEQAEEEQEEVAVEVEVSRVDEAVAVAVGQAGASSSSSSSLSTVSSLSLSTSSVSTRDVSDEETHADNTTTNNKEEEEETTSGNNFVAEGDDRKDKGKELEAEDEDEEEDKEEEEWERKDSESDDSDDEDDANGPLDCY